MCVLLRVQWFYVPVLLPAGYARDRGSNYIALHGPLFISSCTYQLCQHQTEGKHRHSLEKSCKSINQNYQTLNKQERKYLMVGPTYLVTPGIWSIQRELEALGKPASLWRLAFWKGDVSGIICAYKSTTRETIIELKCLPFFPMNL